MKKKILSVLALFATITLVACDNNQNESSTTDNVVTKEHFRGEVDDSLPKIELPSVTIEGDSNNNTNPDDVERTLDVSDAAISLGDEDLVETNAGSGQSEMIGNVRFLTATVNIGYDFEGWWLGDKLLSLQLQYKCNEGENGVEARFSLKDEFKYLEFTSDETECIVTGLKEGYPIDLVIPEGVTEIADNAFENSKVVIVSLPESLEKIGDYAFRESKLISIAINNVDMEIGKGIVEYTDLYELFVPDKTANLNGLFSELEVDEDDLWIKNISEGPSDLTAVGDFVFYYNEEYDKWYLYKYVGDDKNVVLPSATSKIPAYYIDNFALSNASTYVGLPIETVVISDAVLGIGDSAFYGCNSLKEVVISDSVTKIGDYAFYDCEALEKVTIGNNVVEIGEYAFYYSKIKEIVIPDSVTKIGDYAFEYCYSLLQVTLGKGVSTIEEDAFYNSYNIKVVYNNSNLPIEVGSSDYGYVAYNASRVITGENQQEVDDDKKDFIYSVDEDEKTVTLESYLGSSKDVVIPSFGENYSIVLGYSLFYQNYNIETVTLNDYVTTVEYDAFYSCSNLKSVDLKNVTTINGEAFAWCENLETVKMKNVTTINEDAFRGCIKLKTVDASKIETVGDRAFNECSSLGSIDLSNVTYIGDNAFCYCYKLGTVDLSKVETVCQYAFQNCYNLDQANLANATKIEYKAFSNCYKLRDVNFPKVTSIGKNAFEYCYGLIRLTIPETITSSSQIGENSFQYCVNLVEVVNKSTAFTLTAGASGPSYSLISYYAKNVVNGTQTYVSIINEDTERNIYTYDDSKKGKTFIGVIDRSAKNVVIPSDIAAVNRGTLCGCTMEELELNLMQYTYVDGNTYTTNCCLGYFFGVPYPTSNYDKEYTHNKEFVPETLKTIIFGEGISYVPENAFYECENIENLYFKGGVEIDNGAFKETKIKNIYVDSVEIWCNIEFDYKESNPMMVCDSKVLFKNGNDYEELEEIIVPEGVTCIEDYQFANFNMKKVVLPSSLEEICDYAFYNCKNLKEINIPSEVTYIGEYAFANTLIKSIVLPDGVIEIKNNTFEGCRNLISVTINGDITSIGEKAFSNCRLLFNINIPKSLASLGKYAFYNCENLETILLKETSVTKFDEYLFSGCVNLTTITFPTGINSIASTTFEKCDNMVLTTYDNGSYFGTAENPYKWLIKARTPQIFECVVHSDCEKVFAGAFSRCTNLRKIVIPSTCTDYDGCLNGLTNLQYIELPYVSENVFGQSIFGKSNSEVSSKLKTVVINGGTTIPASAFEGISTITKIEITGDITTIGESAFKDCKNANIILPATITRIEASAFENSGIREFEVKTTSMNYLGNDAFKNCVNLVSANLYKLDSTSNYYTKYDYSTGTFYGCTSLETVVLPNGSVCINTRMFYGCTSLESISIPDTVDQINPYAFMNSGIKTITWPSIEIVKLKLSKGAFSNTQLTTLTLPKNLLIQNGDDSYSSYHPENPICGVFEGCVNLTSVNIEYDMGKNGSASTYAYTGKYAFKGCTNLESVYYLASGSRVSEYTYENCSKLKTVNFQNIAQIDRWAFMNTGLESISLASGVALKENAFRNSTELEEVTFSGSFSFTTQSTIREQVNSAFYGCTSLTTVNLATSKAIPDFMFMDCESLNTVNFANVTSIGKYAFYNCGFTSVTLPSTITSVGREAFSGCVNIITVDIQCAVSEYGIFYECTALNSVTLGEAVTSIASGLFYGCTSLVEIEIPSTVTSIGSNGLENCGFVELVIPSSVTSIGSLSLAYNKKLEKVTINSAFTGSSNNILSDCPNLKEVVFNGNISYIYAYMFENDAKLSTITIPSSVTAIGSNAFSGCTSLKAINIPEGVTTIGGSAFENCRLISTITLPASLESVGTDAFDGCYALVEVYNLSALTVTAGADDNGKVAYYAKAVHTSLDDPSAIVTDANGYRFIYDGEKGYLIGYTGNSYCLDLPNSFTYNETTINSYEIAENAFYQNKNIYSIKIPASVTAIGTDAFKECCHLVEIYNASSLDLGTGYTGNGYVAYYAIKIHEDYTEDSILVFDESGYVFAIGTESCVIGYTKNNTDLVIPGSFTYNGVTYTDLKINGYAFAYSNITSVKILDGVKKLGRYAFGYCYSLKHVEVADTVVNDEFHPFYSSYRVETYKGPARFAYYVGNPYNYSSYSYKDYSYNDYLTTVIITKGWSIGSFAFCNNSSLKTIVIPVSVTDIGYQSGYTFYKVTLEKIFYEGTKEQFYKINGLYVSGNDTAILNATKYFYSEEAPTDTENNYWHYVNGEIVIWGAE